MRRRITLAFVAVLAISLFLAGAISLTLVRHAAGDDARHQLLRQVDALAKSTHNKALTTLAQNNPINVYTTLIPFLQTVTSDRVEPTIEITERNGRVTSVTPLPGVPKNQIPAKDLADNKPISGLDGSLAYAAAPLFSFRLGNTSNTVAIALESTVSFEGENTWYFLVAGGVSLLVAGGLALFISRRIASHVVIAADAAEQIAGGDLATRIDFSGREYPELKQLGTSLNTMASNLERSRNLERQFLLSISHDLRTPLTSIRGYAEAIAEGVTDNLEHAAGVLVAESDRLGRLIGDLLDLARIDAQQFSLHFEAINLVAVVAGATDALRYAFDASEVVVSVESPDTAVLVSGDYDRLSQVISNLVENAVKFAQSTVIVRVIENTDVMLEVEDDGPGISEADLPHVFERHFTSGQGKSRSKGTGLGLAIVSELVSAMNGHIEVASPLSTSGGTRITVHLPTKDQAPVMSADY